MQHKALNKISRHKINIVLNNVSNKVNNVKNNVQNKIINNVKNYAKYALPHDTGTSHPPPTKGESTKHLNVTSDLT